jgi:nitroreductase
MAHSVIELMQNHRSIRAFTNQPITADNLSAIITAAQHASSSKLLQAVSVIRVTDPQKRQQLAHWCGDQPYVERAAEFLVFCADFHRHQQIVPEAKQGFIELMLVGAIDAALMGQNALLAAESLGLGGVFIGGIRNQPDKVSDLLGLPDLVFPVVGLCLGYPAQDPQVKPRMPESMMLSENTYQPLDRAKLAAYDEEMRRYYASRGSNTKDESWSSQLQDFLTKEARPGLLAFLQKKGFCLR